MVWQAHMGLTNKTSWCDSYVPRFFDHRWRLFSWLVCCCHDSTPWVRNIPLSVVEIDMHNTHRHTHRHRHTHMHACMHAYTHTYMHAYIHTYIHTYTHIYMYRHMDKRTYIYSTMYTITSNLSAASASSLCLEVPDSLNDPTNIYKKASIPQLTYLHNYTLPNN